MKVNLGRYKKNGSPRTVKVKIDDWDVWGLDSTLAHIIHPALLKLKEKMHGAPHVANEDVPEELRSDNQFDTEDDKFFKRWDWVLDEMIWAFSEISKRETSTDDPFWIPAENPISNEGNVDVLHEEAEHFGTYDWAAFNKYQERLNNGTRLFGVYFQALWD